MKKLTAVPAVEWTSDEKMARVIFLFRAVQKARDILSASRPLMIRIESSLHKQEYLGQILAEFSPSDVHELIADLRRVSDVLDDAHKPFLVTDETGLAQSGSGGA